MMCSGSRARSSESRLMKGVTGYIRSACIAASVILPTAFAAPSSSGRVVSLSEPRGRHALGLRLDLMLDPDRSLSIDTVASPGHAGRFTPSSVETPNFGFTRAAVWARFVLRNDMENDVNWILEVNYPLIDCVELYVPDGKGGHLKAGGGENTPMAARQIRYPSPAFPISLPPDAERTFYMRYFDEGSVPFPPILWDPQSFLSHANLRRAAMGIFYGVVLAMLLSNLFLFLSLRDRGYLYYVIFLGTFGLLQMAFHGLASEYLWPGASVWWANRSLLLFGNLGAFFIMQFGRTFLRTSDHALRHDRVMRALMAVHGTAAVLTFLLPYRLTASLVIVAAMGSSIALLSAGATCFLAGYRPARFFLVAFCTYNLGYLVWAMRFFGLRSGFVVENGILIGAVIGAVLLSFALADRINTMKREREAALGLQLEEERKVAALGTTFKKFVPHEFLQYLGKESIVDIALGDNRERTMSILFADICGFTSLSEGMTPEDNFKFLNAYLERMNPAVVGAGGFIDKYIGDAIMALFDDSDSAVDGAVAMFAALGGYNAARTAAGRQPVQIGVGLNTGAIRLGTVGGAARMQGTVIGDAVNLAARIERMTRTYGVGLLVGEETLNGLSSRQDRFVRLIGRVTPRGKSEAVLIHEIFDADPLPQREAKSATKARFEEAVKLFIEGQFADAETLFVECCERAPCDGAAVHYTDLCRTSLDASFRFA